MTGLGLILSADHKYKLQENLSLYVVPVQLWICGGLENAEL